MKAAKAILASIVLGPTGITCLSFPEPTGPYKVTWTSLKLVDENRLDPFNSSHSRQMMISLFSPVPRRLCTRSCQVPYMAPTIAEMEDAIMNDFLTKMSGIEWPSGVFGQLELEVCCESAVHPAGQPSSHQRNFPILLFGTGLNTTRLAYSATAQHLASMGYEVVVMDHPYETDIVEFPDGTIIYGGRIPRDPNNIPMLQFGLDVRTQDAAFVLDTLGVRGRHKVGYVGQSFGGAAAADAMLDESRIAGGINLDGAMWGDAVAAGVGRPFLIWGSEGHNSSNDQSWGQFLHAMESNHSSVWKRELSLEGSLHGSFLDFSLIGDITGLRTNPALVEAVFGKITGDRIMQILREYVSDFFEFALGGRDEGLVGGPSEEFPEVEFLV